MPVDDDGKRVFTQAYDVEEKSCNGYPAEWATFVIEMLLSRNEFLFITLD